MFAAGIGSLITVGVGGAVLTMLIAAAIWLKAFLWFFKLVKRDSAGVVGTGLLPEGGL